MRPPSRAFWEITNACDHRCGHCRLAAGEPLTDELGEPEVADVARQLVELGVRRVVLSGGEPLLSPHWRSAVRVLVGGGVRVRVFTGGGPLDHAAVAELVALGVDEVGLSLDGSRSIHDRLRAAAFGSSHDATLAAARACRGRLSVRLVTTVGGHNVAALPRLYERVIELGAQVWQLQLLRPLGRALDAPELRPSRRCSEAIVAIVARAATEGLVHAPLHCSVGWMTSAELLRRPHSQRRPAWDGSAAGLRTLAIDARGGVRGCACLPGEFTTASLRKRSLASIWGDDGCFPYSRRWDPAVLAGACARCDLASWCRAGCPSVAYAATGTIGSNPYCLRGPE